MSGQVDYAAIEKRASAVLLRYGRVWQIRTTTVANAVSTRDTIGVQIDVVRYLQGESRIEIGDFRMLFRADANPVIGERLQAGADSLVVMHTEAIKPAGVVLAWWVWARKG